MVPVKTDQTNPGSPNACVKCATSRYECRGKKRKNPGRLPGFSTPSHRDIPVRIGSGYSTIAKECYKVRKAGSLKGTVYEATWASYTMVLMVAASETPLVSGLSRMRTRVPVGLPSRSCLSRIEIDALDAMLRRLIRSMVIAVARGL